MVRVYTSENGTRLQVIDGGRLDVDEYDEPIPYRPAVEHFDVDVAQLQRDLDRAEELQAVWQSVAKQMQDRVERLITDLATHTGRSRASVLAQYVPEATGGRITPA